MKLNLKKIGAIVAGATVLASSVAFAGVMYGNTELVNDNGQPLVKVIVGEDAAASDGVGGAKIVGKIANNAYAGKTLKASATATCSGGNATGTCEVSQETVDLEVTIPGLGTGVHNFGLLIADWMDRELENRAFDTTSDLYTYKKDLLNEKASPYQDQIGGWLVEFNVLDYSDVDGNGGVAAYRINGDNFVPFSKVSVQAGAGRTSSWDEYQFAWFSGYSEMGDDNDEIAPSVVAGVYSIVFAPGMYGLALCPGEDDLGYWDCAESDVIETYRMQIKFLGENWVLSEVNPPTGIAAVADEEVFTEAGTSITLAKEAVYGIVDVGDCLTWEEQGVKVCLDDISTLEDVKPAIVSFTDLEGNIITDSEGNPVKDQIAPGNTEKIYVPGYGDIRVHVYQTAPGYGLLAKWAEFAIYADEIKLEHGKKFINDDDTNWKVLLGWTVEDGGIAEDVTDLREIVLYNPQELEEMTDGEAYPVIDLADYNAYELVYNGLESMDEDSLSIEYKVYPVNKTFDIVGSGGVLPACKAGQTLFLQSPGAEVIKVQSSDKKFTEPTTTDGSTVYIITSATVTVLDPTNPCDALSLAGDLVLEDEDGDYWYIGTPWNSAQHTELEYDFAGDEGYVNVYDPTVSITGGVEVWVAEDIGDWDDSPGATSDLVDAIGVVEDNVNQELISPFGGQDDEVGYIIAEDGDDPIGTDLAAGVLEWTSDSDYSTPFITLRGSVAKDKDKVRKIDVSDKIRHALFTFQPTAQAGTNPDTFLCDNIPEGGTCNVGDVSILVKSIDEVVAPCSVSAGACAVESVNAQIVDENDQALGAEVTASVPYTLTGNLMYLDTEATGLDTGVVITVGGQAVNTVTAAALEEAGMTIDSTNNVVVKEVGNKIIVAGYTAEDTLTAVDQFLSGVKRQ